jgi:hypothetical protein
MPKLSNEEMVDLESAKPLVFEAPEAFVQLEEVRRVSARMKANLLYTTLLTQRMTMIGVWMVVWFLFLYKIQPTPPPWVWLVVPTTLAPLPQFLMHLWLKFSSAWK